MAARIDPFVDVLLREQGEDRKSTRLNSSHSQISYAVFCLKKKKKRKNYSHSQNSYAVFCLKKKKNTIMIRTMLERQDSVGTTLLVPRSIATQYVSQRVKTH